MKIKLAIIGIIVLIVGGALSYDKMTRPAPAPTPNLPAEKGSNPSGSDQTHVFTPAPEITLTALDGSSFTLKDFSGKVVLLNFWASWCPPCVKEFPLMLQLIEQFKGKVHLIAISNDEDKNSIQRFLANYEKKAQKKLNNPYLTIAWDQDKHISQDIFHTSKFPETIILSKDLKMVKKVVGDTDWTGPEMIQFLKSLLD